MESLMKPDRLWAVVVASLTLGSATAVLPQVVQGPGAQLGRDLKDQKSPGAKPWFSVVSVRAGCSPLKFTDIYVKVRNSGAIPGTGTITIKRSYATPCLSYPCPAQPPVEMSAMSFSTGTVNGGQESEVHHSSRISAPARYVSSLTGTASAAPGPGTSVAGVYIPICDR
jgi:hypothetical protein